MPRATRLVVPGLPHHVLQRGNRRQRLFFSDDDRQTYLRLLAGACADHRVSCLAWCLMDNHIHLILVPSDRDGLRAPLARIHTAYAQRINRAQGLDGHLFQGRFASYPMDSAHLVVAARYIENNPVAAGLVANAEDWHWSSARAHVEGRADGLTDVAALGRHVDDWRGMLRHGLEAADRAQVEAALRSERPAGAAAWLENLAETLGIVLERRPRGRPVRDK
jgi:putative transposase